MNGEHGIDSYNIARLHEDIAEIKTSLKDISKVLNGNGSEGLVTKVALNRSSINRAWWWLSALSIAMVTAVIACIKDYLLRPR